MDVRQQPFSLRQKAKIHQQILDKTEIWSIWIKPGPPGVSSQLLGSQPSTPSVRCVCVCVCVCAYAHQKKPPTQPKKNSESKTNRQEKKGLNPVIFKEKKERRFSFGIRIRMAHSGRTLCRIRFRI